MRIRGGIVAGVLIGLALLEGSGARADMPGASDSRFEAALAHWLADDDARALPGLAALAAGGNRAAQVLLALADRMPRTRSPWLARQSRAARNALMRQPGGRSGRSWMEAAARDVDLARLWLDSWDFDTGPDTAFAFTELGEDRAARRTWLAMAARERRGFGAWADEPGYPPALRWLAWQEWAHDPGGAERVRADIAARPAGDPQIGLFKAGASSAQARDTWLASDALAAPLRAFCAATCPQTAATCLQAAYRLAGGYRGLLRAGSPARALIGEDAYAASPKGIAAVLRAAAARSPVQGPRLIVEISETDACTGAALQAEVAGFPSGQAQGASIP